MFFWQTYIWKTNESFKMLFLRGLHPCPLDFATSCVYSLVFGARFWCLSSCIKYIYIFVCLTLEREIERDRANLPVCTSSVECSWLVSVYWFFFFFDFVHANWRQDITAALKLVHFIHFSLCNHVFLPSHWLYGNLSSVSLWPYFLFSMHKHLSCWFPDVGSYSFGGCDMRLSTRTSSDAFFNMKVV